MPIMLAGDQAPLPTQCAPSAHPWRFSGAPFHPCPARGHDQHPLLIIIRRVLERLGHVRVLLGVLAAAASCRAPHQWGSKNSTPSGCERPFGRCLKDHLPTSPANVPMVLEEKVNGGTLIKPPIYIYMYIKAVGMICGVWSVGLADGACIASPSSFVT